MTIEKALQKLENGVQHKPVQDWGSAHRVSHTRVLSPTAVAPACQRVQANTARRFLVPSYQKQNLPHRMNTLSWV